MKIDANDRWRERYFFVNRNYAFGSKNREEGTYSKWTKCDLKNIPSKTGFEADRSIESIGNILERHRLWSYLLHPKQLVRTSLWDQLVSAFSDSSESQYLERFMEKLNRIKIPNVWILGSDAREAREPKNKKKKENPPESCNDASADSVAIVGVETGASMLRRVDGKGLEMGLDDLGKNFLTMKLHGNACLHSDKGAFGGEERKLLLPEDAKFMDAMKVSEVASNGIAEGLRSLQAFIYLNDKVELMKSEAKELKSLRVSNRKLEAKVKQLEDQLVKEREEAKSTLDSVTDALAVEAEKMVKRGIAETKLVMMKEYQSGKHVSWRVEDQINESIRDLGAEAEKVFESFKEPTSDGIVDDSHSSSEK